MMEIPLTQGRVTIVDDEDYPALSQFNWRYLFGYAGRTVGTKPNHRTVFLHNQLFGVDSNVDHKNRDRLDNRRSNLRLASNSLQGFNRVMPERELPRGVYRQSNGRYRSGIRVNYKFIHLGTFDTIEEAEDAYREKSYEVHGEYAPNSGPIYQRSQGQRPTLRFRKE